MEFFNIGGGEILVIILMALLLFGPEDIMKIMKTVGKYTRAASRAWAQLTAGLQGDLLPEEVQDVVNETQSILTEVKEPLEQVSASVNEVGTTFKEEVRDLDAPLKTAAHDANTAAAAAAAEVAATVAAAKAAPSQRVVANSVSTLPPKPATPTPPPEHPQADSRSLQAILNVANTIEIEDVPEPEKAPAPEPEALINPGVSNIIARLTNAPPSAQSAPSDETHNGEAA